VHDAYNAIGNLATVHVVMAVPGCSVYEVLVIHEPGSYDLKHLSYGLGQQVRDRDPQRSRDFCEGQDRRICLPRFNAG
jgi:hypothetical protein